MKPFQVNCSELIADFAIHEDKDVRELITLLAEEYDIELYFEIRVNDWKFRFYNNLCFDVEVNHISFKLSVNTRGYGEYWTMKLRNKSDLAKLIEGIEKHSIQRYDDVNVEASNAIARQVIDKVITLLPSFRTEIENKLINQVNIDEVFNIDIKLGNGASLTSLCYGSNGYDDLLGWYFACEHFDKMNYPFFEWAENEHNAKIRSFDGGSPDGYEEYQRNLNRVRLEY